MFDDVLKSKKKKGDAPPAVEIPEPEDLIPAGEKSLAKVKQQVAEFEKALRALEAQAKDFEVKDDATSKQIVELGTRSSKLIKRLTDDRKARIEKEDNWVRAVNKLYKPLTDAGTRIKKLCSDKFGQYQAKVRLEESKRKKLAEEAQQKLQKQLDDEADRAGVERVEAAPVVVAEAPKMTRTETGSGSVRTRWVWEVEDWSLVPDEFKQLNDELITKQVTAGVRKIPGIKIFEKTIGVFRT